MGNFLYPCNVISPAILSYSCEMSNDTRVKLLDKVGVGECQVFCPQPQNPNSISGVACKIRWKFLVTQVLFTSSPWSLPRAKFRCPKHRKHLEVPNQIRKKKQHLRTCYIYLWMRFQGSGGNREMSKP